MVFAHVRQRKLASTPDHENSNTRLIRNFAKAPILPTGSTPWRSETNTPHLQSTHPHPPKADKPRYSFPHFLLTHTHSQPLCTPEANLFLYPSDGAYQPRVRSRSHTRRTPTDCLLNKRHGTRKMSAPAKSHLPGPGWWVPLLIDSRCSRLAGEEFYQQTYLSLAKQKKTN